MFDHVHKNVRIKHENIMNGYEFKKLEEKANVALELSGREKNVSSYREHRFKQGQVEKQTPKPLS